MRRNNAMRSWGRGVEESGGFTSAVYRLVGREKDRDDRQSDRQRDTVEVTHKTDGQETIIASLLEYTPTLALITSFPNLP